ncbi:MAG TPA: helix-turn-helix domain-containing protein, partial [Thermoleophilaceae bacterium]|nr:helix-turn-helix domain-containing protein [Thermoleophilaceae bacterium]
SGGGLERLAELAEHELGAPVAIVVPRVGEAISGGGDLGRLRGYVRDRLAKRTTEVPDSVVAEVPVASGGDPLGAVLLLGREAPPRTFDVLNVVAIAILTELAVADVREETEQAMRSSLIDLIRGNPELSDEDLLRRAYRLGSDLSRGAVALCAEITSDRAHYVMTLIADREQQALAEQLGSRIYVLIPPKEGEDPARLALATTRETAKAIGPYSVAAFSSFCSQPRFFGRAIQEAELVLDVLLQDEGGEGDAMDSDTYRLLVRTLASHPDEVMRFYEDTVAPIVHYDEQYGTDLVGTVEAYLAHNCNMNATAAGIYAHRHTVAYRLDRVRELTELDPNFSEGRERLGLGLKAYRLLSPRLRR